jgi:sporulation protein YlmC with PRC-barrel domain
MIAAELRGGNKPNLSDALGWIGSRVDDIYGAAVGRLEDVWIDPGTGTPRWLLVREGRFGGRTTLIPFEDATAGAGHVWIPYEREAIRQAPEIEPGAPLTQQVESELRAHFRANAPAAVSHRGHAEPQAPPTPLAEGTPPPPTSDPAPRVTARPEPTPPPAPEPTPYRPIYSEPPQPEPEPDPRPGPAPIPFGRTQTSQTPHPDQAATPPTGPPPLRSAEPPPPPDPPEPSWEDPAPRRVLRPAPPPMEAGPPPGPTEPPPAAIHRAPSPEPDAGALPGVQRPDKPYRIELELEGGLRISGELRSLRIVPATDDPDDA